jgi:glycosyltransferase involved in cell wall biosynthesis
MRSGLPGEIADPRRRIAFYLPSLNGGGAERVVLTVAGYVAARGLPTDLVLAKAVGPYLSEVAPGVRIVDLRSGGVMASLPRLTAYLKKTNPGVLFSAMDHANVVAMLSSAIAHSKARTIVSVRTNVSSSLGRGAPLKGRIVRFLMRHFYRRAHRVIAVSHGVAQDLIGAIGVPPEKVEVIYNPVDLETIDRKLEAPAPHPWLADETIPVILAVGRMKEAKDHSTLIRAFSLVVPRRACRLIILGDGEQRGELESQIRNLGLEKYVDLPGFALNPFPFMKRARVFVLSSTREGLPNSLIEALACGCTVVSTDCPSGPDEILEHGTYGRLVPPREPRAMAEAILEALDRPSVAGQSRARAAAFSAEVICEQYLTTILDAETDGT